MVKYTREQRLRAMRLYERYDCRAVSVINELGHSSKEMLACRHCVWVEVGRVYFVKSVFWFGGGA